MERSSHCYGVAHKWGLGKGEFFAPLALWRRMNDVTMTAAMGRTLWLAVLDYQAVSRGAVLHFVVC